MVTCTFVPFIVKIGLKFIIQLILHENNQTKIILP